MLRHLALATAISAALTAPATAASWPEQIGACVAKLDGLDVLTDGVDGVADLRKHAANQRELLIGLGEMVKARSDDLVSQAVALGGVPLEASWVVRWDALYQRAYGEAMHEGFRRALEGRSQAVGWVQDPSCDRLADLTRDLVQRILDNSNTK